MNHLSTVGSESILFVRVPAHASFQGVPSESAAADVERVNEGPAGKLGPQWHSSTALLYFVCFVLSSSCALQGRVGTGWAARWEFLGRQQGRQLSVLPIESLRRVIDKLRTRKSSDDF